MKENVTNPSDFDGSRLEWLENLTADEGRELGIVPNKSGVKDLRVGMQEGYYKLVDFLADSVVARIEQGQPRSDAVFEEVDSSQLVIYYNNQLPVIMNSNVDPDDTEFRIFLEEDDPTFKEVQQAAAFCVLRRDVNNRVNEILEE